MGLEFNKLSESSYNRKLGTYNQICRSLYGGYGDTKNN